MALWHGMGAMILLGHGFIGLAQLRLFNFLKTGFVLITSVQDIPSPSSEIILLKCLESLINLVALKHSRIHQDLGCCKHPTCIRWVRSLCHWHLLEQKPKPCYSFHNLVIFPYFWNTRDHMFRTSGTPFWSSAWKLASFKAKNNWRELLSQIFICWLSTISSAYG